MLPRMNRAYDFYMTFQIVLLAFPKLKSLPKLVMFWIDEIVIQKNIHLHLDFCTVHSARIVEPIRKQKNNIIECGARVGS